MKIISYSTTSTDKACNFAIGSVVSYNHSLCYIDSVWYNHIDIYNTESHTIQSIDCNTVLTAFEDLIVKVS